MTARQSRARATLAFLLAALALHALPTRAAAQGLGQLGDLVDTGEDFRKPYQPTFVASRQRTWGAGLNYAFGPATAGFVFTQTRLNDALGVNAAAAGTAMSRPSERSVSGLPGTPPLSFSHSRSIAAVTSGPLPK